MHVIQLKNPVVQHLCGESLSTLWSRIIAVSGASLTDDPSCPIWIDGSWVAERQAMVDLVNDVLTSDQPRLWQFGGRVIAGTTQAGTRAEMNLVSEGFYLSSPADAYNINAELITARVQELISRGVVMAGHPSNPPLVGYGVEVEAGATLWSGSILTGQSVVSAGATIDPDCTLHDAQIGTAAHIQRGCHLTRSIIGARTVIKPACVLEQASVGADCQVGPFAHLRPDTCLEDRVKVGNFVETKKTTLREGVKANHLSYLGNADVGSGSNIGAGTITCNYDGARKHPTTIGQRAFIGTNSSLVAPLNIGDDALIAAGSVVTNDVPSRALAVVRAPQRTIEDKGHAILARNARLKKEGK